MTTDWNPNAENVLGLEWVPSEVGHRIINGSSKAAGMNFTSTETEIIDRIWLGLTAEQRSLPNSGGWLAEVYTAGAEIPGPVTTFTAAPNGTSKNNGAFWKDETGASIAIGAGVGGAIGETDLDVSNYVQYTGTYQAKRPLILELETASFPSGMRTVGGRVVFVANREDATGKLQVHLHRELEDDNFGIGEITVDAEIREFSVPFPEICPWTGVGWTDDQIQDFDIHNPGVNGHTVRLKPIGIGKHKPLRIYQMYVEIDYVTENRVGAAVADFTLAEEDWVPFQFLYGDNGGLRWDKLDSTDYTITLRRTPKWTPMTGGADLDGSVTEGGAVGWRYLAESAPVVGLIDRDPWLPDSTMESYAPVLNSDGTIADLGEPGVRGYSFYLDRYSSLVDPVDGQPYLYHYVNDTDDGDSFQYLIANGGGTYELIRLVVGPRANAVDPISISVHLTADDSQVGSTITLTVDEALAGVEVVTPVANADIGNPGDVSHYLVDVAFDTPPTLAGVGQSYYVKIVGPTGEDTCWEVLVLTTNVPSVTSHPAKSSFGADDSGANDAGIDEGLIGTRDALISLVARPDAVSGFLASVGTQTVITDQQCDTPPWLIRDIEFAYLSWSASSLGDEFIAYEIQRSQDSGTTWETIFYITDEDATVAQDYEALRNVQAAYRIRVMATWHVASEWSDEDSVTCTMDDCALLFVSNELPEINQGYVDIGGTRSWKFLTADEKETHILVGRAYHVVTGPLEYRGDQFEATLAIWAGSVPEDTGRAQFDLIESLNTVATSYICVLDETGRRWLSDVSVSTGDRRGAKTHEAKIKVIELTDEPSLVNAVPLPPGPFAVDFSLYEDGPIPESTGLRDAFLDIPDSQDELGIVGGKLAVVEFRGVDQDFVDGGGRRGLLWRNTVSLTDNVAGIYDGSIYNGAGPDLPAFGPALHISLDPSDLWIGISAWFVPPPFSWGELGVIGYEQENFSYLDMHLGLDFPEPTDEVKLRSVGGMVSVEVNGITVLGPCEIPAEILGSPIHGVQMDVALDTDEGLGVMEGVIIEEDSTPLGTRSAPLTPAVGADAETASSTTINVPYPAGISAGNTLYAIVATKNGGTISAAGWTAVPTNFGQTAGLRIWALRKTATGSEAGNLTVTKSTAGIMAGVMVLATGDTDQTGMTGAYNGSASTALTAPALQLFGPYRTAIWVAATNIDTSIVSFPDGFFALSGGVVGGEALRLIVGVAVLDALDDYPDPPIFNAYSSTHLPDQVGVAAGSTTSTVGMIVLHPDVGT